MGLEITGVNLSRSLGEETLEAIRALSREHLVLVFPNRSLTEGQQIAFTQFRRTGLNARRQWRAMGPDHSAASAT